MSLVGSQIGRFRLLRLLGRGGMGEVYLAEDDQLGRQVAIKIIQSEYPDPDAIRLFQREARAIAMFNHPHILPLFDFGEATIHDTTLTYMVMPFCQGGTLAAWMQQRKNTALPSPQDVGFIVQQAASALQYAHNHQIIHQDVKPSNFLIRSTEDAAGRPDLQLADFGVSRSTSASASVSLSVRGTPAYMAPEQWEGTPVPATDQYALAILVYDLLTGRPPFQGGLGQMMYQQLKVTPQAPGQLNPRIPPDLDLVLLHALAKNPEERFASISAFARAFEQALPANSSSPTTANSLPEPDKNALHVALTISEAEALTGTNRLLTLLGGQQVPVSIPAGAHDGQIIRLEGQVEPTSERASAGALILAITIAPPEAQMLLPSANNAETVISSGSMPRTVAANDPTPPADAAASNAETVISNGSLPQATTATKSASPSRITVSPQTRNRRRRLTAILLVGLALLLAIGGSVGYFYLNQSPYPPFNTLAFNDPLSDNSHGYNWHDSGDGLGTCVFTGGAYHVSAPQQGSVHYCMAHPTFGDFAYQVKMTLVKGFAAGLIFRLDESHMNFYLFGIGGDGGYSLYSVSAATTFTLLRTKGASSAAPTTLNQSLLLAVVARGNTINLYINNQRIESVSNSDYSRGQIGMFESNNNTATEAFFSDAKVWT